MRRHSEDTGIPRLLEAVLRAAVRDSDICEGLLGDLEEDCVEELGADCSDGARWWWYAREISVLALRFRTRVRRRRGAALAEGTATFNDGGRGVMWEGIVRDVGYAVRRLARAPGFTGVTVLILGLGIGGTAALYSAVNSVLLEPLPFEEPDRLVGVWLSSPGDGMDWLNQSPATYFTIRDESRTLEAVALWNPQNLTVTHPDVAERVSGMMVTDGIFNVLRTAPALGRAFSPEDDQPDSPPVFILGYGYWQRRFGSDVEAVGRTITVDGRVGTIVGVMPRGVRIVGRSPDVYFPAGFDRSRLQVGDFSYQVMGRMAPGVTLEQLRADLLPLLPLAVERYPGGMSLQQIESDGMFVRVRPLHDEIVGGAGTVLWFLFGAVSIVLLIACANVANLVLLRSENRRRETAIRTAVGASRARIFRGDLLESLVLSLLGGATGIAVAFAGVDILKATAPEGFPRLEDIGMDLRALVFAMSLALLASLVFAILPASRLVREDVAAGLRESSGTAGATLTTMRLRNMLVVSQVGLAVVLLVGSGLMVRSFRALSAVEPGFQNPGEVLTLRINVPQGAIEDTAQVAAFHEEVIRGLEALPGVVSVSGSNSLPMDGSRSNQSIRIEDFPTPEDETPPSVRLKWVGGDYFETLQNPMLLGRSLTWEDTHERARVVVVNRAYAERHWGEVSAALGRRIEYCCDQWHEIVGIVENAYDDGVDRAAVPIMYWPLAVEGFWGGHPWVPRWFVYAVRTSRPNPMSLVDEARVVVRQANPAIPLFGIRTLEEIGRRSMMRTTYTMTLLGGTAVVALLLALVGIYGVIAYSVSLRTREIGLRMALGARPGDVQLLVLGNGLRLIVTGVLAGLVAAVALTRVMDSLLFGVRAVDPLTYAAAAAGIVVVALFATYVPASRASRVDPVRALGAE